MNIKKAITIHKKLFPSIVAVLCSVLIVAGMTYIAHSAASTTTIGQNISTNNLTAAGTLEVTGNATTTGNQVVSGTSTFAGVNLSGDLDLNLKEIRDVVLENLPTFPSSPVEGQMFWSTATSAPYWYDATSSRWRTQSHAATFVVAASDSRNKWKADYIADGTADDVEIQAAINALPSGGGKVLLLEGTYTISATITLSASSTLAGNGWATVLNVAGISGANDAITMSDYTVLSNLKLQGSIDPITLNWHEVDAGNHSLIERIWIDQNTFGIKIASKTDVRVENSRFTYIKDSNGWAAAVNVVGSNDILISDIYIADSHRGIEVEDGSDNVYAQRGFLYRIRVDDVASTNWTKVLDVHSHAGETKSTNVVFRDFYLEDTFGLTLSGDPGDESTYPENIVYENITIVNPWNPTQEPYLMILATTKNLVLKNINMSGLSGSFTDYVFDLQKSDHVILDNIDITNISTTQVRMNDATNITIKNSKFAEEAGGDRALYLRSGQNILLDNIEVKDYTGYGITSDANTNYLTIINSTLSASSTSSGLYGIRTGGDYIKIMDNNVLGSHGGLYGIRIDGNNSIITGNITEKMYINSGVTGNRVYENRFSTSLTDDGTGTVIYKNVGYVTENSGTTTIASGNTSVDVSHGLAITPATSSISIIPNNNLGDASSSVYWISKMATTTFRINVGVDPGSSGADFSWHAGSY